MIDWIEAVNRDGNFALHDTDQDFTKAEEIAPARSFALYLLEYLYTIPEEVRLARGEDDTTDQSNTS